MFDQLTRGLARRVMYVENKATGEAWIGWVEFSRTGRTVYARGRTLRRGGRIAGNFFDVETLEEFWVSAPKKKGGDSHPAERRIPVEVEADAREEYERIRR